MTEVVTFRSCPERDPDGTTLASLINLALAVEQLARLRRILVAVVAVVAVPVWMVAIWPHALPVESRRFLLAAFGLVLLLAAVSLGREWRAGRTLDRLAATNPGLVQGEP